MKHTPQKLASMPLSPKHQRSVEKSKAINQKVESFVKSNFKDSPVSSEAKMVASNASLSNTKAFFESEIKLVLRMVEQSNKLYKQKENENAELHKKMKEYESKIAQLQKAAIDSTANKVKDQTSKIHEGDERKTRKKPVDEEGNLSKGLNRTISEFTLEKANERLQKQWKQKYDKINECLKEENAKLQRKIDIITEHQQIDRERFVRYLKLQQEHNNLNSQYNLLQQRYTELQNKHGQTVTEYEIKLTNLKSLITGINHKISPSKSSEKQAQGYYSINKSLHRNQSQESIESYSSSKYLTPTHAEINLKEQNQYLRTELIRVLDQKGALQIKVNKYKKIAIKYESTAKLSKQQSSSASQNENSHLLSNLDKAQDLKLEKSFKKKRQTSVLLVQSTEQKQKEILQQRQIIHLLKEISFFIHPNKRQESSNQTHSRNTQIEFLQKVLAKLKDNSNQMLELLKSYNKLSDKIQALEKEKLSLEEKSKNDANTLKKYLQESCVNLETPKSEDSTDKAFKNINLMQIEQDNQNEGSKDSEEFSKSMLSHYSQSMAAHQNQVKLMKEKITTLEQTIETLKKQSAKNLSVAKTNQQIKENRIVASSPLPSQTFYEINYRFDMFKQKMNEFYSNTMKELDNWQQRANKPLNNLNSAKALSEIQEEPNQSPSHYQIPAIVQKNLMKMSQEFESIKNSSFDRSTVMKNEEYANTVFGGQKLSRSFIKSESEGPFETFEDIINKKLQDFNQFSSKWIQNLNPKDTDKKDPSQQNIRIENSRLRQRQESEVPKANTNGSKPEGSEAGCISCFKLDLDQIDSKSDWMNDEEMRTFRRVHPQRLPRQKEEDSVFLQESLAIIRRLQGNILSKRSFKSFEI